MLPQHPRRRESPAPRSNQYQWREKEHISPRLPYRDSPAVLTSPQNTTAEQPPSSNPPLIRNLAVHDFPLPAIPTTEEVMNELQEVTIQYVNCADPTISEARRQRVLQGEAKGLMAETAASIVVAASKRYNMVLNGSSSRLTEQALESNHNGNGVYRVLKIDRLDASELNLSEDSTAYTKKECYEILKRIHEGNKATGGLKLVTLCHGIIGFIKFLGPYYMLVITERREICEICGDRVHEVSKSEIISLRNPSVLSNIANSRDENKYKKLLCMVDLTKDFFFSYYFNIMRSFQKNICNHESGATLCKKMFVWNEFLTWGIRHLRNTVWTVALVYAFFKQVRIRYIFCSSLSKRKTFSRIPFFL
ncbi:unnamed protein product, partial [Brassica oleracea]